MIKGILCISNQNDNFVLHEFCVEEMNDAPDYFAAKVKRFLRAAEEIMKETNFCGVSMNHGVLISEYPEFNEVEHLNPSAVIADPDSIIEGFKHFALYESGKLKRIAEKLTLWNPSDKIH